MCSELRAAPRAPRPLAKPSSIVECAGSSWGLGKRARGGEGRLKARSALDA